MKRINYVNIMFYIIIATLAMFLFFMFSSFGIDSDDVVIGYQSIGSVSSAQSISDLREQVNKAIEESKTTVDSSTLDAFFKVAQDAKQFLVDNNYTYNSYSAFDRPMDKNVAKATNCGDYVLYVLHEAGYFKDKPYTTAKGVAKYCKDAGWEINTDFDKIQDGDVVWMSRSFNTYTVSDLVNSIGQSHIQIAYNVEDSLYYNVGSNSSVSVPGPTKSVSVKQRFICSFRVPLGGESN